MCVCDHRTASPRVRVDFFAGSDRAHRSVSGVLEPKLLLRSGRRCNLVNLVEEMLRNIDPLARLGFLIRVEVAAAAATL